MVKLKLSIDGIKKRNNTIFNFAKKRNNPILIFMGGGYSNPINETVKAFKNLHFLIKIFLLNCLMAF